MEDFMEMIVPPLAQEIAKTFDDFILPQSDSISLWALEKERKIYLDEDVDEHLIELQRLILRWNMEDKGVPLNERKPIWLYVMCYGGELDYMWMLIDAIKASATPVFTVNVGIAGSAASLIFLSGVKRFMMPRSKLVIHEGSASLSGDAVKVMDQTESYKKQLKEMKDFILASTNIPRAQLMKKRNNDWELDSGYCLANGACDEIVYSLEDVC